MKVKDIGPLAGGRREMSAEEFEELCALQCTAKEIAAWAGVNEKTLSGWCRRRYGLDLTETLATVSQDGVIAIRRAVFDLLKKNATLVNKQMERYIGMPGPTPEEQARAAAEGGMYAVRQLVSIVDPPEEHVRKLYSGSPEPGAANRAKDEAAEDDENGENGEGDE